MKNEEFFEIFDEKVHNQCLGTKLRSEVHSKGYVHRSTNIIIGIQKQYNNNDNNNENNNNLNRNNEIFNKNHNQYQQSIINDWEFLLQKRVSHKDVCPSLWDLSCGEHLKPGETFQQAAKRGLQEELGITVAPTALQRVADRHTNFYDFPCSNKYDHEISELYFVSMNDKNEAYSHIEKEEVDQIKWISASQLIKDLRENPQLFTPWAKDEFERLFNSFQNKAPSSIN